MKESCGNKFKAPKLVMILCFNIAISDAVNYKTYRLKNFSVNNNGKKSTNGETSETLKKNCEAVQV